MFSRRSRTARACALLGALSQGCGPFGPTSEGAAYYSAREVPYEWVGSSFEPADIEAVEDAFEERLGCRRASAFLALVRVVPDNFDCAWSASGRCSGVYESGWVKVAGPPRFPCAGRSALLHELFHACLWGDSKHKDERWPLADATVPCPSEEP